MTNNNTVNVIFIDYFDLIFNSPIEQLLSFWVTLALINLIE